MPNASAVVTDYLESLARSDLDRAVFETAQGEQLRV